MTTSHLTPILSILYLSLCQVEHDPLRSGKGGKMAPFDMGSYVGAMQSTGIYLCGENCFKHSFSWSARPRVPVITSRIDELMSSEYMAPTEFAQDIVIAVDSVSWDPSAHYGAWPSVSPEEYRRAFVKAVARDIRARKPAETLKLWRRHALSSKFRFELLETDVAKYYRAANIRGQIADEYEFTRTTCYQRIVDICLFKDPPLHCY